MKYINGTARILIIYLVCMIAGQAGAAGIGLLLDPYSKTLALSLFIPLYYAMYWVAWRVALWIGDRSPETATDASGGGSGIKAASWLLAPAVLALDIADYKLPRGLKLAPRRNTRRCNVLDFWVPIR